MRIAILTISDAASRGERADTSGDAIARWAELRGDAIAARALVPDENGEIVRQLLDWCDGDQADVVLTTGGTGLSPRDVTPEATRAVLEREAPGIAERLRITAIDRFPRAALSRGLAGTRNRTLIVNLPGSPGGVSDALTALDPIVNHAVAVLREEPTEHSPGGGSKSAVRSPQSDAVGSRT
jgi:molybdenum cofactor synthesis domain-containing protein